MYVIAIPVMEFSRKGCKKQKSFLIKSNVVKWNHWILRISVMGRCQKVPKSNFQSQFSMNHVNHSDLFFIEEYEFRSIFFVIDILITSIFKALYFLKWCPIFDSSPLLQFSKLNNFIWLRLIFIQKSFWFWKLHNRHCHKCM